MPAPDPTADLTAHRSLPRTIGRTVWRALKVAATGIDDGMDAVTSIPLNRLHKANTARAMADPVYAEIESRRHIDGSTLVTMMSADKNLGLDEWNTQDTIMETVAAHPWWERPTRALARRRLSVTLNRIEHAAQRVTRGWDDTAIWSMDDHLAATIGAQLTRLSQVAHGYPSGGTFTSFEHWQSELARNGEALTAYATRWDKDLDSSPQFPAQYAAAQDALRWVADNLEALWD